MIDSHVVGRWCTYNNKVGNRTDPCGAPDFTDRELEEVMKFFCSDYYNFYFLDNFIIILGHLVSHRYWK